MRISSTNRSRARESHISDYYVTPVEDVLLFLRAFSDAENIIWGKLHILDPCAGGDYEHEMSYPVALKKFISGRSGQLPRIDTIDIREDSSASIKADYLAYEFFEKPDMIITNPPFNQALPIIQKSLGIVENGGWVIMLLRLNFFGSKARKLFWDDFMPQYAFVHHKRIGFMDNGSTDSIEYMHCCWQKGSSSKFCRLTVI